VNFVPAKEEDRLKYLVLRNCFTEECRYFRKGDIVDLPDAMFKDEKNFRPMEKPAPVPVSKPELKADEGIALEISPSALESVASSLDGLVCPVCGKLCKSKFGLQSHVRVHRKQEV